LAAIGAGIAFLPYSKCSKEADIDEAVRVALENYSKAVSSKLSFEGELLKNTEPLTAHGYVYEDDVLMRRGRVDRVCRTSKYSVAKIFCTKYGLVVFDKAFSLTREEEHENMDSYPFAELDSVSVVDEQFVCKDQSKVKVSYFVIQKDGSDILRLPVKHDVAVDKLCFAVNEMISKMKNT